ncbi:hypothetical protein [Streptomyces europaeiscabiei]|uniref:hypothetical protein n=1 Tax=Streptomyces europaeiscabiei TaxID=146819 RepID=UPI0029A57E11|nr:hypothetical protein [Streptomyces europaeiscabiei]MDX3841253.1 hypothetical protein [Streptomyces europaeiscabiei]
MTTAPPAAGADLATRQSLAHGPLGITLLHIERARRGLAPWQSVHRQLAAVGPLIDGDSDARTCTMARCSPATRG